MKTRLMSGDALVTEEYWSITGPHGEGTLMTFSPDPRKNPAAAQVVKAFRAKGIEPEGYTLYTYGAIQAWVDAVKKAGSTDPEKVEAALHRPARSRRCSARSASTPRATSPRPGYVFYVWKDGKYDYVTN